MQCRNTVEMRGIRNSFGQRKREKEDDPGEKEQSPHEENVAAVVWAERIIIWKEEEAN